MNLALKRGATGVEVVVAVGLIGAVLFALFPSLFHGASRRAKASTEATAKLEEATTNRDATAAASVVKIGEANGQAPESPSKAFIGREVPVALSLLPPPDPMALIEAERRKVAVFEGRLVEANRLYEQIAKKAEVLQKERDEALASRRQADLNLERAAAAEHARTLQMMGIGAIALIVGIGYVYLKFTGITPRALGTALADIGRGTDPTVALDTVLTESQQRRVNREKRLAP